MSQQTQIVAAVAKRGYMDGWSDDQLAARQLVKMVEELAEASAHIETASPRFGLLLERLHGLGALGDILHSAVCKAEFRRVGHKAIGKDALLQRCVGVELDHLRGRGCGA